MVAELIRWVRRVGGWPASGPDAELLARFAHGRDEAAFAQLVARHGAMVLGVCRRVLGDVHAAEDAFQATFLVLAKKAGSLARPEALAAWLYGVASRIARKARRAPAVPVVEAADGRPDPLAELSARDLLAALEAEVARLPEAYRLPVVLCCLEGLSQEEAAARLGCTPAALRGRLERGRRRLHERLQRRGLALAAALACAEAARAGGAMAGVASARAIEWAQGAMLAMMLSKVQAAVTVLLVVGALGGLGWWAGGRGAGPAVEARAAAAAQGEKKADKKAEAKPVDRLAEVRRALREAKDQRDVMDDKWSREIVEAREELVTLESDLEERLRNAAAADLRFEEVNLQKEVDALTRLSREILNRNSTGEKAPAYIDAKKKLAVVEKKLADEREKGRVVRIESVVLVVKARKAIVRQEEKIRQLERKRAEAWAEAEERRQDLADDVRELERRLPAERRDKAASRALEDMRRELAELRQEVKRLRDALKKGG